MLCWNDTTNFACRDRQEGRGERAKGSLAREKDKAAHPRKTAAATRIYVLFCCAVSMFIFSLYCVGALAFWRTGKAPLFWCLSAGAVGSSVAAAACCVW